MAFLRINSLQVPVADGGIVEHRSDRPAGMRAFAGGFRTSRRAVKRSWTVTTVRMPAQDASKLEAHLLGLTDRFLFDGSIYSARGIRPLVAVTPSANFRTSTAADGRAVVNGAKFFQAATVELAVTNLLASGQRNTGPTPPTYFAALDGAALLTTFAFAFVGSSSLRIVTSATVNGVRGGVRSLGVAAPASGGASSYIGSAYASCTVPVTLRFFVRNATTATDGAIVTQAIAANVWTRLTAVSPVVTAGDLLELRFEEGTADSGISFIIDGLQLEDNPYGTSFARTWADPTLPLGQLWYSLRDLLTSNDEFSFSFYSIGSYATTFATLLELYSSSDLVANKASFQTSASNARLAWSDKYANGVSSTLGGPFLSATVWTLTTLIFRNRLALGQGHIEAWRDGVFQFAAGFNNSDIDLSRVDTLHFLSDNSGIVADTLLFHPWALSAAEQATLAAAVGAPPAGPLLMVEGSFIPEASISCYASVGPSPFNTYRAAAGWDNAARALSFTLEEV